MKIVFASDQYWPCISGIPVSIDAFRSEFLKNGHEVYLLAPEYPGVQNDDPYISRFKSAQIFFTKENWIVKSSEKKNITALLDTIKPDLIHAHTEFTLGKVCIKYAQNHNIPIVVSSHTNWEDLIHLYVPFIPSYLARLYTRMRMKKFYNSADAIIAPTSLMETLLHLYFVKKPTYVIPTGISQPIRSTAKISGKQQLSSPVLKEFPQLKDKRVLFFAGRLGKEKNIPFLIDIFDRIKNDFPDLVFLITGDGPDKENLMNIVEEKKLSGRIIFTGFVEKKRINDFYRIADIFIFASMVESQGLVVLEAMSCGVPVVAIGKMGTREMMSGDNGGYMVDDDKDSFEEKVRLLLTDKTIYHAKSAEALHHAGKWTIEVMALKVLALYERIISKK